MLTILLILYLTRQRYEASAYGTTRVRVTCKSCGKKYRYCLERTVHRKIYANILAQLSDYDKERADDYAEDDLRDRLRYDFECVPCCHCGDYQPKMVAKLKEDQYQWMKGLIWLPAIVGGLGFLGAVLFGVVELMNYEHQSEENYILGMALLGISAVAALLGGGIALWMHIAHPQYVEAFDPNDPNTQDERLDIAQEFARPVEEAPPKRRPPVIKPVDPIW